MNTEVYVAYLDILGFKDIVYNNTHENLIRIYQNLIISNTEWSLSGGAFNVVEQDGKSFAIADLDKIKVNSLAVSDNLIIWTHDKSMKSFINLIIAARNILVAGVFVGIPMRGGISIGPLSHLSLNHNSQTKNSFETLLGRGLVDAYLAESSQQWSGCVIADSAITLYNKLYCEHIKINPNIISLEDLIERRVVVEYNVPFKDRFCRRIVINWPCGNRTPITEEIVRKSFSKHNKSTGDHEITLKIENTVKFLNDMLS